ncbi:MAG: hypothetical protein KBA51_05870 [Kiritimatiellae bacterium]|nr:hypothetical protein [Kiritimatiellia bacterium]
MTADGLRRWVWALNTAGALLFLGWLVFSRERILYTQHGVVYMLPVLPFVFIFMYLLRRPPPAEDDEDEDEPTPR